MPHFADMIHVTLQFCVLVTEKQQLC